MYKSIRYIKNIHEGVPVTWHYDALPTSDIQCGDHIGYGALMWMNIVYGTYYGTWSNMVVTMVTDRPWRHTGTCRLSYIPKKCLYVFVFICDHVLFWYIIILYMESISCNVSIIWEGEIFINKQVETAWTIILQKMAIFTILLFFESRCP